MMLCPDVIMVLLSSVCFFLFFFFNLFILFHIFRLTSFTVAEYIPMNM